MTDPAGGGNALRHSPTRRWAVPVLGLVVAYSSLRLAWMSDDALINVRAALNLAHGNGAVYNAGERVQTATSPAWFWFQYLAGRLTGEFIVSSMVMGVALATAAALLLAVTARSTIQALVVVAAFVVSPTLLDYSTSGLENALGMAAVAGWAVAWWGAPDRPSARHGCLLGLASAAVVLTRLDYVLLVAPAVAWWALAAARQRRWWALLAGAAAGVLPLALWAGAAQTYYGDVLPNTFHAKTNLDIPRGELVASGLRYVVASAEYDPSLVALLLGTTVAALTSGASRLAVAAAGMWLYVLYVVWIGGDFMAGRFFTGAMVLALAVVAFAAFGGPRPVDPVAHRAVPPTAGWAAALAVAVLVVAAVPALRPFATSYDSPPRWDDVNRGGVADEAGFYRASTGASLYAVLFGTRTGTDVRFADPDDERAMRPLWELRRLEQRWFRHTPPPPGRRRPVAVACGGMGNTGLSLGPAVHLVDACALADPFLARLPYRPPEGQAWRIGHFDRAIPDGYLDAVTFGEADRVADPQLQRLLEEVWARVRR